MSGGGEWDPPCNGPAPFGLRTLKRRWDADEGALVPRNPRASFLPGALQEMKLHNIFALLALAFALTTGGETAELTPTPPPAQPPRSSLETSLSTHGPVAVPAPSEKAVRFYQSGLWWWGLRQVWSWCIPALVLFTGWSGRLGRWAERVGRKQVFVTVLFVIAYYLIEFVLRLPLAYWLGFVRMHDYGLSNQRFGRWLWTVAVDTAVWIAIYAVVFVVLRSLLRWSPRRWWMHASVFVTGVVFFYVLIRPVWVDPLTNQFGAMQDKTLEADILGLADRAGIAGSRVFEVDMSTDTREINAYVTGLGQTKRIVLWDTLLARLDREEVLFIMAHEMGHYVLNHVILTCIVISLIYGLGLFLFDRIGRAIIARYHQRLGFSRLEDVGAIPIFVLLIAVLFFLSAPLQNARSRYAEHEADRFALELTRDSHAAAMGFVKLQTENLGVPYPHLIDKLWRHSHPPLGERIEFANTYRPWETGQPGRYHQLFKAPKPPE